MAAFALMQVDTCTTLSQVIFYSGIMTCALMMSFFFVFLNQIVETLESMSSSGQHNRDTTSEASMLLAAITKFEYVVTLVTVTYLLGYIQIVEYLFTGKTT